MSGLARDGRREDSKVMSVLISSHSNWFVLPTKTIACAFSRFPTSFLRTHPDPGSNCPRAPCPPLRSPPQGSHQSYYRAGSILYSSGVMDDASMGSKQHAQESFSNLTGTRYPVHICSAAFLSGTLKPRHKSLSGGFTQSSSSNGAIFDSFFGGVDRDSRKVRIRWGFPTI